MRGILARRVAALLFASTGVLGALIAGGTLLWPRNQPALSLADAAMNADPATQAVAARTPAKSTEDRTIAAATSAVEALTGTIGTPRVKSADRSGPVFDVARIGPAGEAVIAGRAAPGATVELLRAGTVHDKTVADPSGEFVFVPQPLPPGDYSLTLRATQSDGTVLSSKSSVAVALRSGKPDVPLAVLEKPAAAAPGDRPAASRSADIAILAVESKGRGELYVSGRSEPGATAKLYLNGSYIASTTASAEGRVAFAIGSGVVPGDYRVRLDVVDGTAGLRARAEESFSVPGSSATSTAAAQSAPSAAASVAGAGPAARAPALLELPRTAPELAAASALAPRTGAPQSASHQLAPVSDNNPSGSGPAGQELSASPPSASGAAPQVSAAAIEPTGVAVVPGIDTAVVNRGDNLWHISRSAYGQGVRYSKIYDANRDQIRNPAVIFPGQIFVLPKAPSGE